LAAAGLLLSACAAVGPDFTPPSAPAGAAASGYAMPGDPVGPDTPIGASAPAGPWWMAFGSPELDAVIRLALADSPTVAEARATLERYQAEARAVRGAQLPQIDAASSAGRERINTQVFGFSGFLSPTDNLYAVGGTVSYDLDLFGGRRRATEAATARAERAAREGDAAYLALSGNVALQAIEVAGLRARRGAAQAVVDDDRRTLEMVRRAARAGGEATSAITAATAQLAEDEAVVPPLERRLAAARHRLAILAGKAPAAWTAPDFDLAALSHAGPVPVELPAALVRRRPDILAAEAELHEATAAIGVAVANQYPNLQISAGLTQTSLKPGKLFDYSSSGWSLMTGATAPIFHGGTLKAQRRAAEAEARAAMARYEAAVLRAFAQVSDALAALATDERQVEALARAEAAAATRLEETRAAYRLGGGVLLAVVDAQRQLSRARMALAEARAQRYADLVRLYAATAAGWRTS
jgi:NodT family efflux transporter outer membrane factor (OMF) lipoprotein